MGLECQRWSEPATAPERRTPQKNWTVMVYMVASRDLDTQDAALRDIDEMKRVAAIDKLNVVVHLDRVAPKSAERILITPRGRLSDDLPGPTNSGDTRTLKTFVEWAADNFPATHYLLVLWGHAFGLEFGPDHNDPLTIRELARVLRDLRAGSSGNPGMKLAILGCNACSMSYAESLYELRGAADYMIASQRQISFRGWPYDVILNHMASKDMEPSAVGQMIVDESVRRNVAMTLVNLQQAEGLGRRVKALAAALVATHKQEPEIIHQAFAGAVYNRELALVDLRSLCSNLQRIGTTGSNVRAAAGDTVEFLAPSSDGFILAPDQQARKELHGVGIYAPHLTTRRCLDKLGITKRAYTALSLMSEQMESQHVSWAEFVFGLLDSPQPKKAAGSPIGSSKR